MSDATTTATRTAHEDALWQGLTANPASTAAELAQLTSVPKTTARKILATWAAADLITRANDGDDRNGFRWRISDQQDTPETDSLATEPAPTADTIEAVPADTTPADEPTDVDTATPTAPAPSADAEEAAPAQPADESQLEAPESPAATVPDTTEAIAPAPAPDAEEAAGETDSATSEPDSAEPAPTAAATAEGVCPTCGQPPKAQPRGPQPGSLRGLVEDFLREHPGEEFTPGQIAKGLGGKSSGAVYNACFALVGKYVAEHTCERPNKFRLHPDQAQQQVQEAQQ